MEITQLTERKSFEGEVTMRNIDKIEAVDAAAKDAIGEVLKSGDMEGGIARVNQWLDSMQVWAEKGIGNKRRIILEVHRADFYMAMGDKDGALDCLDAAALQAMGEGYREIFDEIEDAIGRMIQAGK